MAIESEIIKAVRLGNFKEVKRLRKSYTEVKPETLPIPYNILWQKYVKTQGYLSTVETLKKKNYSSYQPYIDNVIKNIFDQCYLIMKP